MRWWMGISRTGRRAADRFTCVMRLEVLWMVITELRYSLDEGTCLTCVSPNKYTPGSLLADKLARRVSSTTTDDNHRIFRSLLYPVL